MRRARSPRPRAAASAARPRHQTPAARAVRVEPRHRRGARAADRPDAGRRAASPRRWPRSTSTRGGCPPRARSSIATASYNGTPPDNAGRFCDWLRGRRARARRARGRPLRRVRLRQPRLGLHLPGRPAADRRPARGLRGPRGSTRAARATRATTSTGSSRPGTSRSGARWRPRSASSWRPPRRPSARTSRVEIVRGARREPASWTRSAPAPMRVAVNRELHTKGGRHPSERSTRHIELELPAGVAYRAGDHLGVIPHNAGRAGRARGRAVRPRPRRATCACAAPAAAQAFLPGGRADLGRAAARRLRRAAGRGHAQPDPDPGRAHRVPVDPAAAGRAGAPTRRATRTR